MPKMCSYLRPLSIRLPAGEGCCYACSLHPARHGMRRGLLCRRKAYEPGK
jgi:hypothetical protein